MAPDGSSTQAGPLVPEAGAEAAPQSECDVDSDCDDGVGCTVDSCDSGHCVHSPNSELCTADDDGTCDELSGCQYETCTEANCIADECKTARCVNNECEQLSLCGEDEMCCAGECVAAECSDGVSCTEDRCGAEGCEHVPVDSSCDDDNACTTDTCNVTMDCQFDPNTEPCDDGTFCNGADVCSGGDCTPGSDSPCAGNAQCDEAEETCTGCVSDADCPSDIVSGWGDCGDFETACDETGTWSRTRTSFTCSADGSCEPTTENEQEACSRETDGLECGVTQFDDEPCIYDDACADGTREHLRTDYVCRDSECQAEEQILNLSCPRETDGDPCGLCQVCDSGACTGTPVDDDACPEIDCSTDTECLDYGADATTNRCAAHGVCKTAAICSPTPEPAGTACGGSCNECDGAGMCTTTCELTDTDCECNEQCEVVAIDADGDGEGRRTCSQAPGNDCDDDDTGLIDNACGGCATLTAQPGAVCNDNVCGTVQCDGEDSTVCEGPEPNGCGGCSSLANEPGDVCGCGLYQCDGADSLVCVSPTPDLTQCNGSTVELCVSGEWQAEETCSGAAGCIDGKCAECIPGDYTCDFDENFFELVLSCNSSGSWELHEECVEDEVCVSSTGECIFHENL